MNRTVRIVMASIFCMLAGGAAQSSWANVTYSYSGNDFTQIENDYALPVPGTYTTAMNVSGWFEVAGPLAANTSHLLVTPLSYSFTDDRSTYTNLDSVLSSADSFEVSTNATGNIVSWFIGVQAFGTGNLWTTNDNSRQCGPSAPCVFDYGAVEPNWYNSTTQRDSAIVWNNPGSWTSTVPEPESYAMLLAGLSLLGIVARRRKQKEAAQGPLPFGSTTRMRRPRR